MFCFSTKKYEKKNTRRIYRYTSDNNSDRYNNLQNGFSWSLVYILKIWPVNVFIFSLLTIYDKNFNIKLKIDEFRNNDRRTDGRTDWNSPEAHSPSYNFKCGRDGRFEYNIFFKTQRKKLSKKILKQYIPVSILIKIYLKEGNKKRIFHKWITGSIVF